MLTHGGQLVEVAKQFGHDLHGWIDLSTGISPVSYPIPAIPLSVWRELPQISEKLKSVAKAYYASDELIVTHGSQSVIQVIPQLMRNNNTLISKVLLPAVGYKEHQKSWRQNGYDVELYNEIPELDRLSKNTLLVIINPNNPSGKLINVAELNKVYQRLEQQDGWLYIDEAFMDSHSKESSFIQRVSNPRCIVTRSVGKFFGLAGIRVGFAFAESTILKQLTEMLGPWAVNGPALFVCERALADNIWQQKQVKLLTRLKKQLVRLLSDWFEFENLQVANLFVTVKHPHAEALFQLFCQNKIYVRLCDEKDALRFGLPDDDDFLRLKKLNKNLFEQLNSL